MSQILNDGVSLQKQKFFHSIIGCCFGTAQVKYGLNCYQEIYLKKFCDIITPIWGGGNNLKQRIK